jgi:site-specific recombinase XerD
MEVRSVRLQDLDFDREQLKVVQGKGKKDRYVPCQNI